MEESNKKTIFPKVDYKQALVKDYGGEGIDYYVVLMSTYIRKKHRGKWYTQLCLRQGRFRNFEELSKGLQFFLEDFMETCYIEQLFGKVNPKQKDMFRKPVFELDVDQREEKERFYDRTKGIKDR